METQETPLKGLLLIAPKYHRDPRGFFVETWQEKRYREAGVTASFVQDNLSYSSRGVLRGLHFQQPKSQGKLITVLQGEIVDVAVDIRKNSPTFGKWYGTKLSSENEIQFWVPTGFAHGFCVTSEKAMVSYKCTEFYYPEQETSLLWNDPDIGI